MKAGNKTYSFFKDGTDGCYSVKGAWASCVRRGRRHGPCDRKDISGVVFYVEKKKGLRPSRARAELNPDGGRATGRRFFFLASPACGECGAAPRARVDAPRVMPDLSRLHAATHHRRAREAPQHGPAHHHRRL